LTTFWTGDEHCGAVVTGPCENEIRTSPAMYNEHRPRTDPLTTHRSEGYTPDATTLASEDTWRRRRGTPRPPGCAHPPPIVRAPTTRHPDRGGEVHQGVDLLSGDLAQGASDDREVLGEQAHPCAHRWCPKPVTTSVRVGAAHLPCPCRWSGPGCEHAQLAKRTPRRAGSSIRSRAVILPLAR